MSLLFSGCVASANTSDAPSSQPAIGSAVRSAAGASLVASSTAFDQCPISSSGKPLVVIKSEATWKKLIANSAKDLGELRKWQPRFGKQLVTVYNVGRKTSLGQKPELMRSETNYSTGTTDLFVKQTRPAAGSMQAMVMTEPCLIALIDLSQGNHAPQIIRIINQDNGATIAQTASVDPEFTF
jgi:hypothetical protein